MIDLARRRCAGVLVVVCAGRRVGVPDRQPAGPAARSLRPVLAGARRRAGPARGGGPRRRRRGLRGPRPRQGRRLVALGRRRRTGAAIGPRGRRERAVGGAGAGRPVRRCRWRWSPSWPTPRRACCWPAASTTTPSATPWRCANARRCGCCGWAEHARAANLFRDRRASRRRVDGGRRRARVAAHLGARRAARRGRRGAAVLRVRPGDRRTAPPAVVVHGRRAPPRRGAAGRGRGARTGRGDGVGVAPDEMVGPVWRRDAVIDFNGSVIRSEEFFFVYRHPSVRTVGGGPHRAGTALYPRPPLVRCDNDRRAGRRRVRRSIRCNSASFWPRRMPRPTRRGENRRVGERPQSIRWPFADLRIHRLAPTRKLDQ